MSRFVSRGPKRTRSSVKFAGNLKAAYPKSKEFTKFLCCRRRQTDGGAGCWRPGRKGGIRISSVPAGEVSGSLPSQVPLLLAEADRLWMLEARKERRDQFSSCWRGKRFTPKQSSFVIGGGRQTVDAGCRRPGRKGGIRISSVPAGEVSGSLPTRPQPPGHHALGSARLGFRHRFVPLSSLHLSSPLLPVDLFASKSISPSGPGQPTAPLIVSSNWSVLPVSECAPVSLFELSTQLLLS
ncbi:hypothetical protein J6590_051998 [Homalodisca vitripennis]|nr:hypothetical protein J6590_051998 [Homalodisca vitripennis]